MAITKGNIFWKVISPESRNVIIDNMPIPIWHAVIILITLAFIKPIARIFSKTLASSPYFIIMQIALIVIFVLYLTISTLSNYRYNKAQNKSDDDFDDME